MVEKIILAKPRGYCAGVDRAIVTVENALEKFGKPVYVRHQIVHNHYVVAGLEKKGAIFIEELKEVPRGSVLVLSAHGSDPKIVDEAKKQFTVIDAVCPLVTKVHLEARRFADKEYSLILIGHKGHQEVIGTMGEAPMQLVESVEDAQNVDVENPEKVLYLTQTTLSVDDSGKIIDVLKKRFPSIQAPPKEDICYATTNRQSAVKELAEGCELILIVGSENSSNSNRLVETARYAGVESYLVPDKKMLVDKWLDGKKVIGISSGASVPDILVHQVIEKIKGKYPELAVEDVEVVKEDMAFSLPEQVRK
ncbi:MAG: 4-hydroxy-3-methylbut-2-enyl diphosphate reductase [Candidatus Woesearchaeota archaeon]|nr:4-hydroxy-3-methylbut-2-enyl diphosphate reductase [Candidatus Woesearchaeota archaeon]